MEELLQLDACRPQTAPPGSAVLGHVQTPLKAEAWERALRGHPDRVFADFLLRGMRQGFRVGFDWTAASQLKSAKRNMRSAQEVPEVVDQYLARERAAGRIIGPLSLKPGAIHVSRFGVIPKPHQPGKWRLIVDLSHPKGRSVNYGVDPELCSLAYASIDMAVAIILKLGRFAELAKLDVASAYRIMPIHPKDCPLLGMKWRGGVRGLSPAVRSEICTKIVHGTGRWPGVGSASPWVVSVDPLFGRLPLHWCTRVRHLRKSHAVGGEDLR